MTGHENRAKGRNALKAVVHPQNDLFSIDYSCLGQFKSIFFVFVAFLRQKKYESKFTPIDSDRGPVSTQVPYQNQ